MTAAVEVAGRRVSLSSPDKALWPAVGFTKRDLVDYYVAAAPVLVPHVAGRALTLGRFPSGVEGRGFAQTECRGAPEWLTTVTLPTRSGETRRYCVVEDASSLAWLANLNTIELHPFLSLAERPDEPTVVVFDLDPGPPAGLVECCTVALELRERLGAAGLASFPKTSGGVGLHVCAPLNTPASFAATKAFARRVAGALARDQPGLVVDRTSRSLRGGKVLVDWVQNDATRSTVAPYSLRAALVPLVSTPVGWDEVARTASSRTADALAFGPADVLERVARLGDVFRPVLELRQALPA